MEKIAGILTGTDVLNVIAEKLHDENEDIDDALSKEKSRAVRAMLISYKCCFLFVVGFITILTVLYLLISIVTEALKNEHVATVASTIATQVLDFIATNTTNTAVNKTQE